MPGGVDDAPQISNITLSSQHYELDVGVIVNEGDKVIYTKEM